MNFTPTADRIVVQKRSEESRSGILLVNSDDAPTIGTVLAVGPGRLLESGIVAPMNLNVGDVIVFGRHAGVEITVDGEKYLLMRQDDAYGVYGVQS